ncbi:MAG: histidine phosphatase family protein [Rubellimicrobium sp.]|nr:histidine phosphatase family protein [Rubellimicrobium sp.]
MTTLWLIRHGPTHETAFTGWRDVPADLSDTAALARLSARLPEGAPVIASTLTRARQTAAALAGPRPRLPDDPDLREFHFGAWDGLGWAEVADRWPDLSRRYWEDPGDTAPPGGESWHEAEARVSRAVDRLIASALTDVIVVAHFGAILTQLRRARRVSAAQVLAQPIAPLSLTRLTRTGASWQVGEVNHHP